MKHIFKKIILTFVLTLSILPTFTIIYAQTPSTNSSSDYTVLTPLPGIGENGQPTKLQDYLPAAFNLSIGIAAALAFVMITIGGITYATSDALQGKSQGKEWVTNAIWGLLLVIGAYAILNTINPQILHFNLSLETPNIKTSTPSVTGGGGGGGGGVLAGYALTADQIALNETMRLDLLNNYGVNVNHSNPCTDPNVVTGCTNLVGLPNLAYSGVISVKNSCSCDVTITGGTEGGHKEHGPNLPVVDLAANQGILNFVNANKFGTPVDIPGLGTQYTVKVGGSSATFLLESDTGHWHVVFK